MSRLEKKLPWILFRLANNIYAISCEPVKHLILLGDINTVPNAPEHVRGVSNIHEKLIPLVDMRKLFGLKPVPEEIKEFEDLINARKQDHINWLAKLEESVREHKEFTLTTDPHACAFGKWYDTYQTEDLVLKSVLKKVNKPHIKIHSIGVSVKQCMNKNDYANALKMIEEVKTTEFTSLVGVLSDLIATYKSSKKELVLVLEGIDGSVGIIADEVISVEYITEIEKKTLEEVHVSEEYFSGVGKRKDGSTVLVINYENKRFLNSSITL
jgi:chemotaxis signal transduction protein